MKDTRVVKPLAGKLTLSAQEPDMPDLSRAITVGRMRPVSKHHSLTEHSQASTMEHQARGQLRHKPIHLLDLDQNLMLSICKMLSVQDKLQLRLVSSTFQRLLDEPAPGCGIWGVVDLHDFRSDLSLEVLYRRAFPHPYADHTLDQEYDDRQ